MLSDWNIKLCEVSSNPALIASPEDEFSEAVPVWPKGLDPVTPFVLHHFSRQNQILTTNINKI